MKTPAFQFYPKDFLSNVQVAQMTTVEVGAYWLLCCHMWNEGGSLQNDTQVLARLARMKHSAFTVAWQRIEPCFAVEGERLMHQRFEREMEKQKEWREKCSKGGKAPRVVEGLLKGSSRVVEVNGNSSSPSPISISSLQTASKSAREKSEPIARTDAGTLWDDFCAVGREFGFDHRLSASPKEYGHLVQLTGAYTADELHAMAAAFWSSRFLPSDRNLGLFANKAGALFKHVQDASGDPFGAPVNAKQVQADADRDAVRKWGTS